MLRYTNKELFLKGVEEKRIVFDKDDKPFCAICGKSLISGFASYFCASPCPDCDPEYANAEAEMIKAREEEEKCNTEKARKKAIQERKNDCFYTERAFEQTFANDDLTNKEISEKLQQKYIANFEKFRANGGGLLFTGGTGTGKTFLARAVLHALIEKGYTAKEIKFSKVYNKVCANGEAKEEFIENLCKYNIVFIDDLGTERTNEGMSEFLYSVIDALYENKIPMIFTTNLPASSFNNTNDGTNTGRIYSRIGGVCMRVPVNNANKRAEELKALASLWKECKSE